MQAESGEDALMKFVAFIGRKFVDKAADIDAKSIGAESASSSGADGEPLSDEDEELLEKRRSYRPHLPGRVLYIYR